MVQESTMICFDNSDWMRNGDFCPSRLQCQQDAASLIAHCKLRANPENAVGILSMADTVEVLSTLTQEANKINSKVYQIQPKGESNFINGIKVAHLALKHRQNRNHKMRIVLFVGSPIDHLDTQELLKLAKKLKKEKVLADVVCFGEADAENSEVMKQFIEALNGRDGSGSNLVVVSPGSTLTEALATSPVCRGEDGAVAPVVPPGGGFDFGMDSENDPDLALALRVSLEEQRQRQQEEARASGGTSTTEVQNESTTNLMEIDPGAMTEEQQLEWALRLSLQERNDSQSANTDNAAQSSVAEAETSVPSDETKMEVTTEVVNEKASEEDQLGQLMNDPELLRQLVADLPGVDPDSQEVQDAINRTSADKVKLLFRAHEL
uniref:26S proteasome non-ATPase regulatory subunit 4 n=1 Tax=Syphacia muris TaxID=451379 RepID=A0A0N5AVW0_9BILA